MNKVLSMIYRDVYGVTDTAISSNFTRAFLLLLTVERRCAGINMHLQCEINRALGCALRYHLGSLTSALKLTNAGDAITKHISVFSVPTRGNSFGKSCPSSRNCSNDGGANQAQSPRQETFNYTFASTGEACPNVSRFSGAEDGVESTEVNFLRPQLC